MRDGMRWATSVAAAVVVVAFAASCGSSELDRGRSLYAANCAACHRPDGTGANGPALADVNAVWTACLDEMNWIALGSEGWKAYVGPTYGSANTPVTKQMPGLGATLTQDDIARIAAFTRVEFGGAELDATLTDCGL